MGRTSTYTSEFAKLILSEVAEGKSLRAICEDHTDLPAAQTIRRWILEDREGFQAKYTRAKEIGVERMAEEIIEISDETSGDTIQTESGEIPDNEWINRSRLRVDTRKWLLSKLIPKKYGDKLAVGGAEDLGPVMLSWRKRSEIADTADTAQRLGIAEDSCERSRSTTPRGTKP